MPNPVNSKHKIYMDFKKWDERFEGNGLGHGVGLCQWGTL